MKLRQYIHSMNQQSMIAYAERCRISPSYLRIHVKYASKDPSVTLIKALARHSQGSVSLAEVLEHFGITETSVTKAA